MAKIRSGADTSEMTVGSTSKAAYVEQRDTAGRSTAVQSKATYSVCCADFTPAATATDLFRITGSATKTIRIISLSMNGTANAAATIDLYLIRRSTANNGGTFVSATTALHDSQNAATTVSSVGHYTANAASLGTTAGTLKKVKVMLPIATTGAATIGDTLDKPLLDQPITLRGVAESLCLNYAGAALPAGAASWTVNCTWIEE